LAGLQYYVTPLGKQVLALGLKLKNLYIIPELSRLFAHFEQDGVCGGFSRMKKNVSTLS
jgi:hypothetical protein